MQRQCCGVTKAGERCRSWALPDSPYCAAHDPTRVVAMAEYRRRGGQARSNAVRASKRLPRDRADVAQRLIAVMDRLEAGAIEPAAANALANLARAYVAVLGDADLLADLAALKAEVAALKERAS